MKKMLKSSLSLLLTLVMVFSVFAINATTVSAAEAGTLTSNAISLSAGNWYTKYWTNQNYSLNCYNKIVVPARGYITFTASKPFDSEGEICSYDFDLYSADGTVVWSANTGAQKDSFNDYYTYNIGLAAGTYYMNIDPSFYVYRNSAPIETQHKYTFTQTNYWEIESNNNMATATALTLGKTYTAVYTEESYSGSYEDYFKFKFTKGKRYRVTIGNYSELDAGTTMKQFYDPASKDLDYKSVESGNSRYYIIDATTSGWHYLKFHNDGSDKGVQYTITVKEEKITSPKTSLSTCSSKATGKLEVKWNLIDEDDDDVTGYEIQIATNSKFTKGKKTKKITDFSSYSDTEEYTFSSLIPGKKYYIRVRTYIKFSGKTYYSGWSKSKSKQVKKISKVTNSAPYSWSRGKLEADWSSVSGVSGYQVQIATNSKFTKNKKVKTITGNEYEDTEYEFTKLKVGKKYYTRVRAFVKVGKKKYYGPWSKSRSATVDYY